MYNQSILKFIVCILLFWGCNNVSENQEVTTLYSERTISELDENYFLTDLRLVKAYKDKFYFSDFERSQVLILNNDLSLFKVFGEEGEGPEEFQWVNTLNIFKDTIYALDGGGRRINQFTLNGDFVKTIIPPDLPSGLTAARFAIFENSMIFPASARSESDLVVINRTNGNFIKKNKTRFRRI